MRIRMLKHACFVYACLNPPRMPALHFFSKNRGYCACAVEKNTAHGAILSRHSQTFRNDRDSNPRLEHLPIRIEFQRLRPLSHHGSDVQIKLIKNKTGMDRFQDCFKAKATNAL